MPSEKDPVRWLENPWTYLWGVFILVTTILTYMHCRIWFEPLDEFFMRIENGIASFFGFIRASFNNKDNSREIGATESSYCSAVTVDVEDVDSYEGAVASLAKAVVFSPQPRPSPKTVIAVNSPKSKILNFVKQRVSGENDEEPIDSLSDAPEIPNTRSRFSKYLTNFLRIKPSILATKITSRESISGYEADTESGLQDNMEMEVISNKRDQVKVQEGKLIIYFLDGNLIGSNETHAGAECDTDGPLEGGVDSRITCTFQNDNLPSESHGDSLERYDQNDHHAECLGHQLAVSAADDKFEFKFDSRQKNHNGQYNQEKEDSQSWFKQYYDRILRRGATFSGPLSSSGGVKYSYTGKINEEVAMKIERESIHSNDEMKGDTLLKSNNSKWVYLHKDMVHIYERCSMRHIDSDSSDQEDDSNHKLRENTIAEVYEEDSPNVPKLMATTSSLVQPRMQVAEIHPNKMVSEKSMDKKIIMSNAEESISCEERRGNEEENNAILSETRKLKLWKSFPAILNEATIFFDLDLSDESIRFQNCNDHDCIEKSDDVCEGNEKIFQRARRFAVDPKSILEFQIRFLYPRMLKRPHFGLDFLGDPNQLIIAIEFGAFEEDKIKELGVVPNRYKEESARFWKLPVLLKSCPDLYTMHDELLKDEKKKSNYIFLQFFEPQQDKRCSYSSIKNLEQVSDFDYDDLSVSEEFAKEMGSIVLDAFKLSDGNDLKYESKPKSLFSAIDHHVIQDTNLILKDPSVRLDEQSLIKQRNLPEVSGDVDIDEGNVIAESKKIFKTSGPGIEKRRFSCDDSIRRNTSDSTSNHKRRGFMRSVSFAETVSIVPNIETTDHAKENDQKGFECIVEQSDASNFRDDISLDDPIPVSESNSGSKTCDKNREQEQSPGRKLDIDSNAKFVLRRSLSLDPWPKPSKIKLFMKMEKCFLEGEEDDDEEFRLKERSSNHDTDLPACAEEDDREFSEAGNSSVEDVGESTTKFGILNAYFWKNPPRTLGQEIPNSKRHFTLNNFLKRDFE